MVIQFGYVAVPCMVTNIAETKTARYASAYSTVCYT